MNTEIALNNYSRSSTNAVGGGDNPGIRYEHTATGVAREGLHRLTGPAQNLQGALPRELSRGSITAYMGKKEKYLSMTLMVNLYFEDIHTKFILL